MSLALPPSKPVRTVAVSNEEEPRLRVGRNEFITVGDAMAYIASVDEVAPFVTAAIYYGRGDHLIVTETGYDTNRYSGLGLDGLKNGYQTSSLAPEICASESFRISCFDNLWCAGFDVADGKGRYGYAGGNDYLGAVNAAIPGLRLKLVSRTQGSGESAKHGVALTVDGVFNSYAKTAEGALARGQQLMASLPDDAPTWLRETIQSAIDSLTTALNPQPSEPVVESAEQAPASKSRRSSAA